MLKLNGSKQIYVHADDINLQGDSTQLLKNTQALLFTSMKINLDVNAEKTNISLYLRSFKNVAKFRYLGKPLTNENYIQGEMKSRLNSVKGCYHLVQNVLSSCFVSKNPD